MVVALSDIGRTEIDQALAECDRLGRDSFLAQYDFQPAKTYFLVKDGRHYDSKAVVGAAHGFLPGQRPLAPNEFSGGRDHAVKLLADRGYQVVRLAAIGEPTVDGLVERVRVLAPDRASSEPRLYQPITLLWAAARAMRGEQRLLSWEETYEALTDLLRRHGLRGERPRPDYPVLALYQAGLWTLEGHSGVVPVAHGDAKLRRWFEEHQPTGGLPTAAYELLRVSGLARASLIDTLTDRFFTGLDESWLLRELRLDLETVVEDAEDAYEKQQLGGQDDPVVTAAQYLRWCQLAENREAADGSGRREERRNSPLRLPAARRAVLWRSGDHCENPRCTGEPQDRTDRGLPILDVDHIEDLAQGGRDHPSQMIALCPNCHATKTRGRSRHELKELLLRVAAERHQRLQRLDRTGRSTGVPEGTEVVSDA
ncbi:HNH endonuclease [Streptomyces sp. NA04227]|uniref:HNH endonuclease signature motif containing protein n=1 Tax=Streptomyces sp. NA04227 TaxID=2742136 RepID=UPI00159258F7|nr:HNH endonuclease signature motif containing protein [Streptomyces sp. NA04227]QKW08825.1 HNH endonuclease [Streptomyces sp. NA04227]